MQTLTIVEILWTLLLLVTNGLAVVLWNKIKRMESDMTKLEGELYGIKFNYLNRFDDLKQHLASLQLTLSERIGKLEVSINQVVTVIQEVHSRTK